MNQLLVDETQSLNRSLYSLNSYFKNKFLEKKKKKAAATKQNNIDNLY